MWKRKRGSRGMKPSKDVGGGDRLDCNSAVAAADLVNFYPHAMLLLPAPSRMLRNQDAQDELPNNTSYSEHGLTHK